MKKGGFTLIDLLVTIAIIALLSSVVLASLSSARAKARDAQRVAALDAVRTALEMYYDANGTYYVLGTGYIGGGTGYISYEGGAYTKSLTHALFDAGYLPKQQILDPTQGMTGYMVYLCDGAGNPIATTSMTQRYVLYATKESPTATDIANANASSTCNSAYVVPTYLKNYAVGN